MPGPSGRVKDIFEQNEERQNGALVITGDKTRDGIISKIIDILKAPLKIDNEEIELPKMKRTVKSLATEIELQMHRATRNNSKEYLNKARSIISNLQDKANPELRMKILTEELSPEKFATMSPYEMASEKKKKYRETIQKAD